MRVLRWGQQSIQMCRAQCVEAPEQAKHLVDRPRRARQIEEGVWQRKQTTFLSMVARVRGVVDCCAIFW